jgi:hypothetical protein
LANAKENLFCTERHWETPRKTFLAQSFIGKRQGKPIWHRALLENMPRKTYLAQSSIGKRQGKPIWHRASLGNAKKTYLAQSFIGKR